MINNYLNQVTPMESIIITIAGGLILCSAVYLLVQSMTYSLKTENVNLTNKVNILLKDIQHLESQIREKPIDDVSLLRKVTRVEVIDEKGRSYINWKKNNNVTASTQDEGRTLKIFIDQN